MSISAQRDIKTRNKFGMYILIFVCLLIIASNSIISRLNVTVRIGVFKLEYSSFAGVFTAIELICAILLIVCYERVGYYIVNAIFLINIITMLLPIIREISMASLPGIAIIIVSLIIALIVYRYQQHIKRDEEELFQLACTDALTGLQNRRSLQNKLGELVDNVKVKETFALVFIDLDNFKNINDLMGHDFGDEVLCQVMNRWRQCMLADDFMARLGGDEFAIIVRGYQDETKLLQHIQSFSDSLKKNFNIGQYEYFISASFGIAQYPSNTDNSIQLLRFADTAMYHAKKKGKGRICIFDTTMLTTVEKDVALEKNLRNTLKNQKFYLVYQPQYELNTKKLRGFETLIRMDDEFGNAISPSNFIPLAERTGLIIDIERWVFLEAMMSFQNIIQTHTEDKLLLSINVSVLHMLDPHFIQDIKFALEKSKFPSENLELEITESVFISSLERAKTVLQELRRLGIKIALDDFGTGYASLSYLNQLPIDLLKIDKSFIDQMSLENRNFISAIISMGHQLEFDIISEGVEEQEQIDLLKNMKCDYIQGYIWGKPVKLPAAIKLIAESLLRE